MFFVDGHCDTITTTMKKGENLFENSCHIDLKRLSEFDSPVQVFSVWLEKNQLGKAYQNCMEAINFFRSEVEKNKRLIGIVDKYSDIEKNIFDKKISGIIGVEGCEVFEGKIENVYKFIDAGAKIFTLTWNYENELGFGAVTGSENGLKPFGKEVVKILNAENKIIDVSHLNEAGFWDICKISDKPFIASHSNSKAICNNVRNLSDEQIKEISQRKGIIGINLYPPFLTTNFNADLDIIVKHIEHIMKIGGEDILGLGCDFDGIDKSPKEITQVSDVKKIYDRLVYCFGESNTLKIMGKNFLCFFQQNFS